MEVSHYGALLEQLEAEILDWSLDDCTNLISILERVRVRAWARIFGGAAKSRLGQDSAQLLTLPQVAARLAVPVTYAYELARQHKLPVVRLGKYVRVPTQEFEQWLVQQASLEGRIDSRPHALHSLLQPKRRRMGIRGGKNHDRVSSKSQPKKPVDFRSPVITPSSSAESSIIEPTTTRK